MILPLEGKVAIITGANQGLGFEISRKYIEAGASVIMCARNAALLATSRELLAKGLSNNQYVETWAIDVSDAPGIEKLIRYVIDKFHKIDILVNNAGVYGPMGPIELTDWHEWLHAIEINLFGSILMARAVLPIMKQQRAGKIIQLSGGGATAPMPNISAYAVSKAGIVRFAESLAEEVREFNIDVNCIAPGALNTQMLDEVIAAGPEKVGKSFFEKSKKQKVAGGAGLEIGADLAVFLASDASNGITAKLISAVWDNWQEWPKHLDKLNSTEAYTLRRIAGRDRGFAEGDR